jgi:hypothetical protein|tara:strand:+ start:857 stop:1204 length:348 start_codon:yes stop_codon:yes gene_type:complete
MATTKDTKRISGGVVYRGKKFPGFNKPKRNSGSSKHKMEVLAKKGNEIKVVKFGHKDYGHNYSGEARDNYLKRSAGIKNKSGGLTKDDKFSANHWARKVLWAGSGGKKKSPPKKS